MANAGQVLAFCRAVDAGEKAELTVVEVICAEAGSCAAAGNAADEYARTISGFRQYDFQTQDGKVNIRRTYYCPDGDGNLVNRQRVCYPADQWQYTEDGYLVFSGSCFSEDRSYEYKPRGFYEVGCSNMPYPEVVSYSENADGTDCAFRSEIVVQPFSDGTFRYLSNKISFAIIP